MGRIALKSTCCAALVLLAAAVPPAHAATPGGAGVLTATGRIGSLRLDRSNRAGVVRMAGRPQAETIDSEFSGPLYDALGYSCVRKPRSEMPWRFNLGQRACRTVFFINQKTGRLGTFLTSSTRYSVRHVRVGDTTRTAERRLHRQALSGCEDGIYLGSKHARMSVALFGGTTSPGSQHVIGGRVYALALHSTTNDVDVTDCL